MRSVIAPTPQIQSVLRPRATYPGTNQKAVKKMYYSLYIKDLKHLYPDNRVALSTNQPLFNHITQSILWKETNTH